MESLVCCRCGLLSWPVNSGHISPFGTEKLCSVFPSSEQSCNNAAVSTMSAASAPIDIPASTKPLGPSITPPTYETRFLAAFQLIVDVPDSALAALVPVELVIFRGAIFWRLRGRLPFHPVFNPTPLHLLHGTPAPSSPHAEYLSSIIDRSFNFSFSLQPLLQRSREQQP